MAIVWVAKHSNLSCSFSGIDPGGGRQLGSFWDADTREDRVVPASSLSSGRDCRDLGIEERSLREAGRIGPCSLKCQCLGLSESAWEGINIGRDRPPIRFVDWQRAPRELRSRNADDWRRSP